MKIHNFLPLLLQCVDRWKQPPSLTDFVESYYDPMKDLVGVVVDHDSKYFHSIIEDVDWAVYRAETLTLDPAREEARLKRHIQATENLFGFKLEGEAVLFGTFTWIDGYARFDCGTHRVFLGVDESHGRGAYLDVLETHELAHVARESRPEVWEGFGLNPVMTQAEFTEHQPVIEHLMGEGFSCAVSEILVPGEDPWHYAYQTRDSLAKIYERGPALDKVIHAALRNPNADYGRLYNPSLYGRGMPGFTHYVWAWQWAKSLIRDLGGGDPRALVSRCSKDFVSHALAFELRQREGA